MSNAITRVCPPQVHPLKFLGLLVWLDGRKLLDVLPPFWQDIISESLYTFREDGAPQFQRILTGMAKKNAKTLVSVLCALYKLMAWEAAGAKGNQVYFLASDLGQANDALDLCKKLVRTNRVLEDELTCKQTTIERKDGKGFIEVLPVGDAGDLHGKTFLFKVHDELHTQKDYRALEALELDRTRPDAVSWYASYAAVTQRAGCPLVDMQAQHLSGTDPRLFVRWYAGTIDEASPAMNTPLGPTREGIEDARRSLPSWIFRRLYQNLPGQPDGAAFNAESVYRAVVQGRVVLPPQQGRDYASFCDLSGGGEDDATLAIGHRDADERIVVDLVMNQGARSYAGTFDPQQAVATFGDTLKQYGLDQVEGDQYAGRWPVVAFSKFGISYYPAQHTRSQLYSRLEPLLNSGQVQLLDHATVVEQLIGLVRRGEKIDHAAGQHDDHSNAVAGLVSKLSPSGPAWVLTCDGQVFGEEARPVPPPAPLSESELLSAPWKLLTPEQLEARAEVKAARTRRESMVERSCRQSGFWWPRT